MSIQDTNKGYITIDMNPLVEESSSSLYKQIADLNLRHCKPDPDIPPPPLGDPRKFIRRQTALLLTVADRTVRTKAFEILGRVDNSKEISSSIINQRTWEDLSLVSGTNEHPNSYLGSAIDETFSTLGKTYLLGLIASPTATTSTLQKRQAIVKQLVSLPGNFAPFFEDMAEDEEQLISFWHPKLQLPGCINRQYPKYHPRLDKILRQSPIALDVLSSLQNTKKITATALQVASTVILPFYTLSKLTPILEDESAALESYATRFIGSCPGGEQLYSLASLIPNDFTQGITASFAAGFTALGLRSKIEWTKADLITEGLVQKKLVSVASYYKRMKRVYQFLSQHKGISDNLEHFEKLEAFIHDERLRNLFSALESRTFNSRADYLFRRGNVLFAWNQLRDKSILARFEPALTAMAEIDAFTSVAQLVKNSSKERVKYCFPTYVTGKQRPEIGLTNFWNPLVNKSAVVTNSLKLSAASHSANAIITGPNAAGKSTVLKAVTKAIVLAQSLGIAPADTMTFTPFTLVTSSMNIPDNIQAGKSLFQEQAGSIAELSKRIQKLPRGHFSFTVLDELFTGTSFAESSAIAYATLDDLGRRPKNVSMVVTHDPQITTLEKTSNFKNYKLSTEKITHEPLYRIEPGISTQHIALEVAIKSGMNERVVKEAKRLMARDHK